MKTGWQTKSLGDLCVVIGGGTPSKDMPEYFTGDIPWATVRDLRQELITDTEFCITKAAIQNSSTNVIPRGNVVIATRVGLGKVCLVGQDTAINQDLRGIIPRDKNTLSVRFLFWWLKSVADDIVAQGTGATVQGVKLPFVKSLQIPLLPISEQDRIVGILDAAFAQIASAKSNAEQNLQNARSLFESYLNKIFTKWGEGWVEKRLDELYRVGSSKRVLKSQWKSEGVPFYRGREVTKLAADGYVKNELFVSEEHFAELAKQTGVPMVGDIVITAIGTIGNAHIVRDEDRFYFKDASVLWMKRTSDTCSEFTRFWLKSAMFLDQIDRGNGATVDTLTIQRLQSMNIAIPNASVQQKVAASLSTVQDRTQHLESLCQKKLAALDELKKSLLHLAFSGNL